jgi:hypothetical protein
MREIDAVPDTARAKRRVAGAPREERRVIQAINRHASVDDNAGRQPWATRARGATGMPRWLKEYHICGRQSLRADEADAVKGGNS